MGRSVEDLLGTPDADDTDAFSLDIGAITDGVSVTWLFQAFRMDRQTVKKKLGRLQPIKMKGGNIPLYDFVQASSRLAPRPEKELREILKTVRPTDLPRDLQAEYWETKLKKQKYERLAGLLWHTDDVVRVFGEACKHIKSSVQLWINTLERKEKLTPSQFETIQKLTDQLLDDMHNRLSGMTLENATPSSVSEDEDENV